MVAQPGPTIYPTVSDDSDSTYMYADTNASGTYTFFSDQGDTPTDFATILTIAVNIRYGWSATPTNTTWDAILAHITKSDGTTFLAGGDLVSTPQTIVNPPDTDATIRTTGAVGFVAVDTAATKTDWDGMQLHIGVVRTRSKGGGTEQQRIYETYITGTYTPSTPASPRETRTFRRVLQAVNRAGSFAVGQSGVLVPERRILVPVRG